MRSRLLVGFVLATGCQTYALHRAALVPHATPLPTDGQPLQSGGELALGASNIADPIAPTAGNPEAGDAVPGTQLRGVLTLRATPNFSLGAVYERGLAATAHPITTTQPPIDNGDVSGYGVHLTWSVATSVPGLRVGLSTELLLWSVPWVEYTSCVMNCIGNPGFTTSNHGTDTVPTLAFAVVPSYRSGRFTVFGGATARNQPTATEKVYTTDPDEDVVQAGKYNLTVHAGAEADLGGGVRASLILHQTVTKDPIAYGPSLAAMLTIPLGSDAPPPASPATAAPGAAPALH